MYTIQDVSKKTGLSAHTLRYYEKEGLITGVERSQGGFRQYTDEDLEALRKTAFAGRFTRNAAGRMTEHASAADTPPDSRAAGAPGELHGQFPSFCFSENTVRKQVFFLHNDMKSKRK